MGLYINPTNGMTKEQFLEANAKAISFEEALRFDVNADRDNALTVWVDHYGDHTAAAIATSRFEHRRYLAPDKRQRKYYLVPVDKLNDAGLGPDFPARFRNKAEWENK